MIPGETRTEIIRRISNAEREHGVRVIYAVQSGSRAWGLESPNSDFDVRFIYAHSKDWYVAVDLEEKRDVIEYDIVDEIDINGWDVRKALKLFRKSNPAFIEWLQSSIVYVDDGYFAATARDLIGTIYSAEKGIYHYRSMAKTNYRGCLKESVVPLKKYFYVLRPLLSIQWLEKFKTPAPIEFDKLRTLIEKDSALDHEVMKPLERKKMSLEKELAPAVPIPNDFIEKELTRLENFSGKPDSGRECMNQLNALFHAVVS